MDFQGTYDVRAAREMVFAFITDPAKIGKCMADVRSLEMDGEDKFTAIVRVGVGFVRGDFKFRVSITEKEPPARVRLKGSGVGAGSNVDLDTLIELTEIPNGTKLSYKTNVKLRGLIVGLAQRVLGGAVDKTVASVFECVRKELER
jgi:hypothetical protein